MEDRPRDPDFDTRNAGYFNNREKRRKARESRSALDQDRERHVNRMTNWQRNQWARAGYPKERIAEFTAKVRPYRIERAADILREAGA